MAIKHTFVTAEPDSGDPNEVSADEWNDDHVIDPGTITTVELGGDVTAAGKALLDDANAAAQRTTLGLAPIAASGSAADLSAGTVPAARMPALTGDVTTVVGAVATTIANSVVTLAKIANIATARILGRTTAGAGVVEELTGTQITAMLDAFTSVLKGLVPASGGGTTAFLRADSTFAVPSSPGFFGDATDGNATDPSTPTRSMFWDTLTLSNGFNLNTGGYPHYARKISVPSGSATIRNNGGAGGNGTNDSTVAGAAGTAATGGYYSASVVGGNSGGAGGATGAAPRGFVAGAVAGIAGPSAGNNGNPGNAGGIGQGGSGGAGGAAAAGSGGASGAGGNVTLVTNANGDIHNVWAAINGLPAKTSTLWTPGSGGGAGGAANTNGGGGGGGGGGGYNGIVALEIAGVLTIAANGGAGGNGATGTTGNNGGGGGGGGGSGGVSVCAYGFGTAPTVQANGGSAGTGGTGFGTGKNGGNGGAGGAGLPLTFQVG